MSEDVPQTAWEPFRDPKLRLGHRASRLERVLTEADAEFIGPRTTGTYEEESLCENCMGGFMASVMVMRLHEAFRQKYCPECVKKWEDEEASKQSASRPKSRAEKWGDVCPPAYVKTDVERLQREGKLAPVRPVKLGSKEFVDMILGRPYSDRGIGLTGDSRLGKTRLMFALLREYYMQGRRVFYLYAPDFSDRYAALMGESAHKGNAFLESCINSEVWFLDDLGKGRLSEAAQRALLRVIEKRTNSERPIFVTTNEDGDTLIKRMSYEDTGLPSEYAGPMINRLREFCDFYQF